MVSNKQSGMLGLRSHWRFLFFAAPIVPAIISALSSYLNSQFVRQRDTDWPSVAFAGGTWLFLGAFIPIVYLISRRNLLKVEQIGQVILAHFAGAVLLCIGWTSTAVMLALLLNLNPPQEALSRYYLSWILSNLPWSVFLYFTSAGCIYAFRYYQEAREHESQQLKLSAQLAEARLSALRMQLNPHFLFNSLNAITVLVRDKNTMDASRMLELLSSVLRQVLRSGKSQEVTLQEEIRFIEQYLAIEQVRFSDRLRVQWSVDADVYDAIVPEFILQPVVENSIKHAAAWLSEACVIELVAHEVEGMLELSVQDNGPGFIPATLDNGIGLANTRDRLKVLFGEAGQLHLFSAKGGGTIARIRFPLSRHVVQGNE